MDNLERKIKEEEEKSAERLDHYRAVRDLYIENQKGVLENIKLTYESNDSTLTNIVDLAKNFLTLSTTGYLGLLVAPTEVLKNVSMVKNILISIIIVSVLVIFYYIFSKTKYNKTIHRVMKTMNELQNSITEMGVADENHAQKERGKMREFRNGLEDIKNKT